MINLILLFMRTLFVGIFFTFLSFSLLGQGWLSQGARSGALANNGVTLTDVFSYHHNPGALGYLENTSVGLSYEARYALKELQSQGFAVAIPLKVGVISAGGQFYGYDAYRTTRAGVGYSMKLAEKISAGVQINYLGMRFGASEYGRKDGLSAEFGALARITEDVQIGFSVVNITRSKLSEYKNERFGTLLRLGVSYRVLEELTIMAEIEQEVTFDPRFRFGVEYQPIDLLYLRVGAQGAPMDLAFGFGLNFSRIKLDLSTQYNQVLGWTPAISLIVDFNQVQ